GDSQTVTAALEVADVVIIPTESGDLDMDRALMTYQVAHGTRRALLFNKADWTRQYRDAYEGAAAVEGLDVLDAEVHRRVAYRQAIGTRPTDLGEFAQVAAQIQEMLK
ncbi:ParA family protein, partial [Cutibacterium acnes subsp. acnes]|nr:ParA family protein [Cutibacterium acnes subsp. acnes]